MAFGFKRSGGEEFYPSFRFNAVSGDATINGSERGSDGQFEKYEHQVDFPVKLAADFAGIELGWIAFGLQGPSFHLVKYGERMPAQPDKDHKQGFKLRLVHKEFGICDWANSSRTVGDVIDLLHDQFLREEKANPGKVPVITISGTEKTMVKTQQGNKAYKKPVIKITGWVPRPELLDVKPEPVKEATLDLDDDDYDSF